MKRQLVTSSSLASIGYDSKSQILEVEFNNGGVYQYFDVPASIHSGLMNASSHGQYFDRNVKKTGYRFKEL